MTNTTAQEVTPEQIQELVVPAACKIIIPSLSKIHFVQVGCGGTGSWLAPSVVRIARMLRDGFGQDAEVLFVDPDTVEEKNTYRQNFSRPEVGAPKAVRMMERLSVWGVPVAAQVGKIGRKTMASMEYGSLIVVLGCVDGAEGRKGILNAIEDPEGRGRQIFWIDAGNYKFGGQVLIGRNAHLDQVPLFPFEGYCSWIPLPARQHPELIKPESVDGQQENNGLSCAELVLQGEQALSINSTMAAIMAAYLEHLLIWKDLAMFQTYIDHSGMVMQSTPITPETLAPWAAKAN